MKKPLVMPDSPYLDDRAGDGRLHAPSAARNLQPIAEVLERILPESGAVLELASGTGQHIAAFAGRFPGLSWQPGDIAGERLASIRAWRAQMALANLQPPMVFDAVSGWGGLTRRYDFIYVVNLLHLISAAEAQLVLNGMAGALNPGGQVMIYGPFRDGTGFRSPGDERFDASLRAQDATIGYKASQWVLSQLAAAGLTPAREVEMPANNLVLHAVNP